MSLSTLISGADCGPANPLQGLSKRFDQDRGAQQDQFGRGKAGSSREAFRTQQFLADNALAREAATFYNTSPTPQQLQTAPNPFNLASLGASLGHPQVRSVSPAAAILGNASANAAWAADFAMMENHSRSATPNHLRAEFDKSRVMPGPLAQPQPQMAYMVQSPLALQPPETMYRPIFNPTFARAPRLQMNSPTVDRKAQEADDWAAQFANVEQDQQKAEPHPAHATELHADDLAATARLLIDSVKDEQNPKFKNSNFLALMRNVRDRIVVVEGNEMVDAASVIHDTVDLKGKGRANPNIWADEFTTAPSHTSATTTIPQPQSSNWPASMARAPSLNEAFPVASTMQARRKSVHFDPVDDAQMMGFASQDDATRQQQSEPLTTGVRDEMEDVEENEYLRQGMDWHELSAPSGVSTGQTNEWDRLQSDWDQFEATATGVREVATYQFQANNPYVLGGSSRTYHHSLHSTTSGQPLYESVLEKEAAVQREPLNSSAWFELGVKQQENEREEKAIIALSRAVELDPSYSEAWLALAISQTNENNRSDAYDAIQNWIERSDQYKAAVLARPFDPALTTLERHRDLVNRLLEMARMVPEGEVDADIQIALAVLLNTSEEYDKAGDCFRTALAVRPNDALLYNRVGATLANGGQAEEALQYYYRALELNPSYIRARFNLGISCINLRMYNEAAQYVLDALMLQDSDATGGAPGSSGLTSGALWDSLRTACLHLQRLDLASLCEGRDLAGFRAEFEGTPVQAQDRSGGLDFYTGWSEPGKRSGKGGVGRT